MTDIPVAELIAELEAVVQFIRPAAARPTITAAAAALRALSAEVEGLRREREWRPLGEMPKRGKCWASIPHGSVDIECLVQWMPPNKAFPQGQWRDTAHESCVAWPSGQTRPAYGMPLPPPPATEAGS